MKPKNLLIQNFRGFTDFAIRGMGTVTLLVGTNNSGKTTILEALNILFASEDLSPIWSILSRRGEDIWFERESGAISRQVDIRRLFRGHEIEAGTSFVLNAETEFGKVGLVVRTDEPRQAQPNLFDGEASPAESTEDFLPPLVLSLEWTPIPGRPVILPISRRGGITLESIRRSVRPSSYEGFQVRYVTASSLQSEAVTSLFEEIVLTPAEELVTKALQFIEPDIERIASSGGERVRSGSRSNARGGILVKMKGIKDRIPIGSMGDGIWRMLGLALSVVQSAGGLLLIDEIDTGLHHTVMKDLWRFLYRCAKQFDVQIVATTHSRDCFQSLAVICRDDVSAGSEVTIHRIERGQTETIAYTEQEIIAAADLDMEVR